MSNLHTVPRFLFITLISPFFAGGTIAASLSSTTLDARRTYVQSANARMEQRLSPGAAFLWLDEAPGRLAKVRAGQILVSPLGCENPKKVPDGLIHHWVGAGFIAHATFGDVQRVVRDYSKYEDFYTPNVTNSKAIAIGPKDRFRWF